MGGAVSRTLAPHTHKRGQARSKARYAAKQAQIEMEAKMRVFHESLMSKHDVSKTGTLNAAEVKKLCEAIMNEVTPQLGGVTDDDVNEIMCLGGDSAKPEVTFEELPTALSTLLAIKTENKRIHELFVKYDFDKSGALSREQLKALMVELNDGIIPTDTDLDYIMKQFDLSGDGQVDPAHLKSAIGAWYCLAEESLHPETVEEAKAAGYTDEQIAEWEQMQLEEDQAAAAAAVATAAAEAPAAAEEAATPAEAAAMPAAEEAAAAAAAPAAAEAAAAAAPAAEGAAAAAAPAAEEAAAAAAPSE